MFAMHKVATLESAQTSGQVYALKHFQCQENIACLQMDDPGIDNIKDLGAVRENAQFIQWCTSQIRRQNQSSANHPQNSATVVLPPPVRFIRRGQRRLLGSRFSSQ